MKVSGQEAKILQQAQRTYEWSQNHLIRKSDGMIVAEVALVKGIWVAKNKSNKTSTKIGEYKEEGSARHAVDLHFGLKANE